MSHWLNQRKSKKYSEGNMKKNIMYQNLWADAKLTLRWHFIAVQSYHNK